MKEYKRLTAKGFIANNKARVEDSEGMIEICALYNRLAELEDKIENGTLIELPCKVGEPFYETDTLYCEYRKHEVSSFTVENGELILIDYYCNGYKASEVCFTKSEAEQRLKE